MPLHLYLIRHGETEWSLAGRHTGRTDLPLTRQGESDAGRVGDRLRDTVFGCVLTSPRRRARQTCELARLNAPVAVEPKSVEWNYGDYEGLRSEEIHRLHPDWELFRDGCPYGETPAEISDRADRLIGRLRTLDGNVALFTHGHFGRVLGARWIGLLVGAGRHLLLSPASISVLGYEHDDAGQPAIVQWNTLLGERFEPAVRPPRRTTINRTSPT